MFNVRLIGTIIEYCFRLFENPHALANVAVPAHVAAGYQRYRGAPPPGSVGGKPWFAEVLNDEEWLRDPDKKSLDEFFKAMAIARVPNKAPRYLSFLPVTGRHRA